jgi:hypothetical protein
MCEVLFHGSANPGSVGAPTLRRYSSAAPLISLGAAEFLTLSPSGLWLALIGWFVLNGAASERYATLADRVQGLRVADVMATNPVTAPAWFTVPDFVSGLLPGQSAQVAFPVVDVDGTASVC